MPVIRCRFIWGAGAALLIAALLVRVWPLELMLYDLDEGVASIYALQLVEHGDIPLFGVRASLGFYNPPLFIYLIAPAFLISKSPLIAVGMLQFGIVLFIGLLGYYLVRRQAWSWGVVTLLTFACLSPGPLYLTNRLWGHSLIPALSIATLLLLLRCIEMRAARWPWLLLPLAISAAQQVHFSGALLLVNAVGALVLFRVKPVWRYLVIGVCLATATYIPYLVQEYRTSFADLRSIGDALAGKSGKWDPSALWLAALHSLSDFDSATALQENYHVFLSALPTFRIIKYMLPLLLLISLALFVYRVSTRGRIDEQPVESLSLIWCIVPLLSFTLMKVTTVPAYWLVALPGPWILAGSAVEWLMPKSSHVRLAVGSMVIGIVLSGFALYHFTYINALRQAEPALVRYPSYRDQRDAVAFVCSDSRDREVQLVQNNGGDGIDYQLLYLIVMFEGNGTRLRHPVETAATLKHYIINERYRPIKNVVGWAVRRFGLLEVWIQPDQVNCVPGL
ncbi:MAG: hypothetical protein ACR2IE_08960 [Candidatus Sumerlaeaceae bacterium]